MYMCLETNILKCIKVGTNHKSGFFTSFYALLGVMAFAEPEANTDNFYNTGHFTQVVWDTRVELGLGYGVYHNARPGHDWRVVIVVGRYAVPTLGHRTVQGVSL